MDGVTEPATLPPPQPEFSLARKAAIEMLNQGVMTASNNKGESAAGQIAYQLICAGVANDPTMGHGWFVLGNALGDLGLKIASAAAYRRALALPTGTGIGDLTHEFRGRCLVNLTHTLYHLGHHREALKIARQVTKEYPDIAYGWVNLSLVSSILNDHATAIAAATKAIERASAEDMPTAHMSLAFAHLHARHYSEAFKWFEARFAYKLKQFLSYPYPKWQGEEGVDLFLVSDQGLGDSIDFLRFVPMAVERCRKIYLATQPELMRLLRSMFGKYENVEFVPLPQPFPPATHWLTLMSLPVALGLTDQQILNTGIPDWELDSIDPTWKQKRSKLHVGLVWAGSAMNEVDRWRSIPLDKFVDLARVADVEFYSLQVGERTQELHNLGMASMFRDLSPYIRDVMDGLAVMKHLDLLISVDSAPIHMAGLVGLPTWVPVAFNGCDWRFGRAGRKSIWYPETKLYRQDMDNDWTPVFDRIASDLKDLANGRK